MAPGNGKSIVSLHRCADYDKDNVMRSVDDCLADLGGMESFVKSGQRVLIKPNLLIGKSPEKAVNTHYSVVRAVMERVADCGGKMTVGDSPSFGSAAAATKKCGILDVAKSFGVQVVTFKEVRAIAASEGRIYHQLPLAADALDADVIINLPKLKTHAFMSLTLGVKNLFGCVVGMAKGQWHLKAGQDPLAFARMLAEINAIVAPALTIMDGVIGMDGNGPGSGDPKKVGAMLASADAVAMDRVVMDLIAAPPDRLFVLEAARQLGYGRTETADIDLRGEAVSSMRVRGFKLPPPPVSGRRLIPKAAQRIIKRTFTSEPHINHDMCTRCGTCKKICPPQVISFKPMRKTDKAGNVERVEIDRTRCIHCFCCQEVCPEGAITVRKGLFIKKR